MSEKINIEFEITNKFRGGLEDYCEICENEGRITFYTLASTKIQFLIFVCSKCLKSLENETKTVMTVPQLFKEIEKMEKVKR